MGGVASEVEVVGVDSSGTDEVIKDNAVVAVQVRDGTVIAVTVRDDTVPCRLIDAEVMGQHQRWHTWQWMPPAYEATVTKKNILKKGTIVMPLNFLNIYS